MNAQTQQAVAAQEMRYDQIIDLTQERFIKLAPSSIAFEAEKGFAIQLLQTKPELMQAAIECPGSLRQAITNIAAIGLSLNPAKKEAYLITRSFKVQRNPDRWETRICLDPSYIGLCNLATNSESVLWVQAKHVRENDVYENTGPDTLPVHRYNTFKKDRGAIIGYYCVAKLHNGDYLTTEMDMEDINKVRGSSESFKKGFGPWVDWPDEQGKKTVIRRGWKQWPKTDKSDRLAEAISLSNENEGFEPILTAPVLSQFGPQQKEYFDSMIEKNDALGMFVFQHSIEETIFNNLFHSFPKGQKGKYQQVVRALLEKGGAMVRDIVEAANEHAQNGHDLGMRETVEGLSKDALAMILDQCSTEAAAMIRELETA